MSAGLVIYANSALQANGKQGLAGGLVHTHALPAWVQATVWFWVCLSTIDASVLNAMPYADFAVGLLIVGGLFPSASGPIRLSFAQYLFLGFVFLGGVFAAAPLVGFYWAGKLGIIFLISASFNATPSLGTVAGRAFIAAGAIHSLVCVCARFGVVGCQGAVLGDGRVGTVLSGPGALWRTVVFFLSYSLFILLTAKQRRTLIIAAIGLAISASATWFDGSRTAVIMLPVATIVIGLCQRPAIYRGRLMILIAGGLSAAAWMLVTQFDSLQEHAAFSRFTRIFFVDGSAIELLEDWDWARLQGIRVAVDAIQRSPILGNGLLTTVIDVDHLADVTFDTQVVHNAYLQIWGDLGLFAFVAFLTITWRWLPQLTDNTAASWFHYQHDACLRYAALTTLTVFVLSFFLHPMTVTLRDWIAFICPMAVLHARGHALQIRHYRGLRR